MNCRAIPVTTQLALSICLSLGAFAQGPIATIDILDRKYDVFSAEPVGGIFPTFKALNNRREFDLGVFGVRSVATTVGTIVGAEPIGDAGSYSPEGGRSVFVKDTRLGEFSVAEDISDNGVIIGWHHEKDLDLPPKTFLFSNDDGFRYLEDLFPAVSRLAASRFPTEDSPAIGTQGLRINNDGEMIIRAVPRPTGGSLYRVTAGGIITPIELEVGQGVDLNNLGEMPQPIEGAVNAVINDSSISAGWEIVPTEPPEIYAAVEGTPLPSSKGARATAINNAGDVAGWPGYVWTSNGVRYDIRQQLAEGLAGTPWADRVNPNGSSNTFINDAMDIVWANFYLRPACPEINLRVNFTGLGFGPSGRFIEPGKTMEVKVTITNEGRSPMEDLAIALTPSSSLFSQTSPPNPPLPQVLEAGARFETTAVYKAEKDGLFKGSIRLSGSSTCGPIEETGFSNTIVVGDALLIVNVDSDKSDPTPGDNIIDVDPTMAGQQISLRAAIEAVNAGNNSPIHFAIPGGGLPSIALTKPLPAIARPITIDGRTQSPRRQVEVRGNGLVGIGLDLAGGESLVRGLVLHGFTGENGAGIRVTGPGECTIDGCWIGIDASGRNASETTTAVLIDDSPNNLIGDEFGNVIHGTIAGVVVQGSESSGTKIPGNRIGLDAGGDILTPLSQTGISIEGGDNLTVGPENGIAGGVGISISGGHIDDVEVIGNRIGLDHAGQQTSGASFAGILAVDTTEFPVTGLKINSNKVAGNFVQVMVSGIDRPMKGLECNGNELGLAFDGSGDRPSGLSESGQAFGLRLDSVSDATVRANLIAGHAWDVLVSGTPKFFFEDGKDTDGDGEPDEEGGIVLLDPTSFGSDDEPIYAENALIEGNVIGLNRAEQVPASASGKQRAGIVSYDGAKRTTIENNVSAGHYEAEIWLQGGTRHIVQRNRIGTSTGEWHASQVGVHVTDTVLATIGPDNIIGRNTIAGIELEGESVGTRIHGNLIGTDVGGTSAWPNGRGIIITSDEFGASPDQILIEDNLISGNDKAGVSVFFEGSAILKRNQIGGTAGSGPLANEYGVRVSKGTVEMESNRVTSNTINGIFVSDSSSRVRVLRGPIFKNADSLGETGIAYTSPPFSAPKKLRALRSVPDENGMVTLLVALPPVGKARDVLIQPQTILEVYGNPSASETQGRVLILSEEIDPSKTFAKQFELKADSSLTKIQNFTATLTRGSQTSVFSEHTVSETIIIPELSFAPSSPDEIKLVWPESPYFKIEGSSDIIPAWRSVNEPVTKANGLNQITIPINEDIGSEIFRLTIDPEALFSD